MSYRLNSRVNSNGDVVFHTDLITMEISVKNAERILSDALNVLEGRMPKPDGGCDYCSWAEKCNA